MMAWDEFNRWQHENAKLEQDCFEQAQAELGSECSAWELLTRAQEIKSERKGAK